MNRFESALAQACRAQRLAEKWLLAPSLRAGHQWLQTVAASATGVVNVRLKSLKAFAVELAGATLAADGRTLISSSMGWVLIGRALESLRSQSGHRPGYLSALQPSLGFVQSLWRSIQDLRLAGVGARTIRPAQFEVADKGRELIALLGHYETALRKNNLVDYADVLQIATATLPRHRFEPLVLLPADLDCTALERALLDAVPADRLIRLPVDEPVAPFGAGGAVEIFYSIGEINEVREVLRRCLASGQPLDRVELLHTDAASYVPLIYEEVERLRSEQNLDSPLATFAEGIPARFSRPGRGLAAWLTWLQHDCPQRLLTRMIHDGLIEIPGAESAQPAFAQLACAFRSVPIGFGRDRYLKTLDEHIAGLGAADSALPALLEDDDERSERGRAAAVRRRRERLEQLRALVAALLEISPAMDATQRDVLRAAGRFVRDQARCATELDNYARRVLLQRLAELEAALGDGDVAGLDLWKWLAALPDEVHVRGLGPQPGCLHVASIYSGGHSGRPCTFIIGLDSDRFPGAAFQDPVVLDSERAKLSGELRLAARAREKQLQDFARLLARLRGHITLSYSSRSAQDDAERFPSPVLGAALRAITRRDDANQTHFAASCGPPVSFAPARSDHALGETEWWLWRLCAAGPVAKPEQLVAGRFPHLGRGFEALRQRASAAFSGYDGFVPETAATLDPTRPGGGAVSASRLQTLGRCPLAFFFRYALGLEPPEELQIDPTRWLQPAEFGTLLHEVFYEFMNGLIQSGRRPDLRRDNKELFAILDARIECWKARVPPASEGVFRHECNELYRAARTFLALETQFCQTSEPLYLETSIGLRPRSEPGPLDRAEPAVVPVGPDKSIRACGYIDRIDRVGDPSEQTYAVWDYKSFSPTKYDRPDPFWQGRIVQHALYLAMATTCLREKVSPQARVTQFGFFFPGTRGRGRRLQWTPDQLAAGAEVMGRLCAIIAGGAFLATNNARNGFEDCRHCDYVGICGDLRATVAASQHKLANPANTTLEPFRQLRPEKS
jgi:ATP-dependent helicase/nuclease subunit B